MATSISEILEVKSFLRQQHIIVSEEWVEACISFLKQEQQVTSQNLKKRVHQQWLIADLEEIACPSLPQELPTAQKLTLNGNFALQVQGIKDISKPAYSQLKELTSTVNSNVEFSSEPKAAIPQWEAKPTRMLMLALTDGCTQVQGMEYRTINFLSPNFSPGIKVLIKGPIECRFGVLLLAPENISILGGAVESKLEQFSRENLLREQLHIEREDDIQRESTETSSYNSRTTNLELPNDSRADSTRNSEINSTQQNRISSTISSLNSNPSSNLRNYETNSIADVLDHFDSDDDFDQNIDYGVLDEIENSQIQRNDVGSQGINDNDLDIWQEDEDVLRDHMMFQDANPEFKMPFTVKEESPSAASTSKSQDSNANGKFTTLSAVIKNPVSNCISTIKTEKVGSQGIGDNDLDIWQEDEDVLRDHMEFQDANPEFKMPFTVKEESPSAASTSKSQDSNANEKFTTLSAVIRNPVSDCVVTIKGYIINVLSKLECTKSNGFSLSVKITDGTAKIDVDVHNKVLENIIGESAETVIKKQHEAAKNPKVMKEIMKSIFNCKMFLQDYNFLMDIKFVFSKKPCIIKCVPDSKLDEQQRLKRVSSIS